MTEKAQQAQHVAVPVQVWSEVVELLREELPMKRVEALVGALRQCQPIRLSQSGDLKEG